MHAGPMEASDRSGREGLRRTGNDSDGLTRAPRGTLAAPRRYMPPGNGRTTGRRWKRGSWRRHQSSRTATGHMWLVERWYLSRGISPSMYSVRSVSMCRTYLPTYRATAYLGRLGLGCRDGRRAGGLAGGDGMKRMASHVTCCAATQQHIDTRHISYY